MRNGIAFNRLTLFRHRPADTEANAPVVGAYLAIEGFEAVMTASTSALLDFDLAGQKVEIVMEDDGLIGLQLIETQSFERGFAGEIHISKRL